MEKNRTIVEILVIIFGTILLTGCITQTHTGNVTTTAPEITPLLSSVPLSQTDVKSNDSMFYVTINPIPDHFQGDFFEINGTTNIGDNEKLEARVSAFPDTVVTISTKSDNTFLQENVNGSVKIQEGNFGVNTWSYQVNLSGFYEGFYAAAIYTKNARIYNSTEFYLCPNNLDRKCFHGKR